MIPRGLVSSQGQEKDPDVAMLERRRSALRKQQYKQELKAEVSDLERKYGKAVAQAVREEPTEKFWSKRGIKVTDLRRRG